MLERLFRKKKKEIKDFSLEIPDDMIKVFKEATELLNIKDLQIRLVPYIFNSPTIYAMGIADKPIEGVLIEEYCRGSYMDNENTIYMAKYAPVSDEQILVFEDKEIISTMLHEVRHVWQKTTMRIIFIAVIMP